MVDIIRVYLPLYYLLVPYGDGSKPIITIFGGENNHKPSMT